MVGVCGVDVIGGVGGGVVVVDRYRCGENIAH